MSLSLGFVHATNARDMGGYPTVRGTRVRTGRLYRANALNRLSPDDVLLLGGLKLACLIDFRHPHEIDLIGPDRLPPVPPRLVALPVFDLDHEVFTTVGSVLAGHAGVEAILPLRDGGAIVAMRELYRWFVTADAPRQAFAEALRIIATDDHLPLLFHCTAGKDRTGWLAAVILSLLGVDRSLIVSDYLHTNELNAAANREVLSRVAQRVPEPELLLPLLEARLEYLDTAFAEVDRVFGGIDGYVREGLGLDEATVAALRANLLLAAVDVGQVPVA